MVVDSVIFLSRMADLTTPGVSDLLTKPNHAVLSTINADGSVHSAVIWVNAEGDKVAFNGAQGRVWPANIERDARVTLVVINQENPYEYVYVQGSVAGDTTDGADEHIDKLAKKYMDVDEYPFRKDGETRLIVTIAPDKIVLNSPS